MSLSGFEIELCVIFLRDLEVIIVTPHLINKYN